MKKSIISITAVLLLAVFVAVLVHEGKGYRLYDFENTVHFEKNWSVEINGGEAEDVEFPFVYAAGKQDVYRFSTVLSIPEELKKRDDYTAFVSTNHAFFSVYLDGVELYSYTGSDVVSSSHSPGNAYVPVSLGDNYEGKEFVLEIAPALDSGISCWVYEPEFASYSIYMRDCFFDCIPQGILSMLFLLLGLVMLMSGTFVKDNRYIYRLRSMGMFFLLFGIYAVSENLYLLYVAANPYAAYLVNFIMFAAMPIPIMMFIMEFADKKYRRWYYGMVVIGAVNFLCQIVLHFSGISELRDMVMFTHLLVGTEAIFSVLTLIMTDSEKQPRKKILLTSVIPLAMGVAADMAGYYYNVIDAPTNAFFTQLGIVAFSVIHLVRIAIDTLSTYRAGIEHEFYKRLAFKDSMTGLSNRTAYTMVCRIVDEQRSKYNGIVVFCADINNLKIVNDTLGHMAGDELILKVASCLQNGYGAYGMVFRTGGDEFVGLLQNVSYPEAVEIYRNMQKGSGEENADADMSADFAIGFDVLEECDDSVIDCIKRADEKMYEDKKKKKGEAGLSRQI